MNNCDDQQILFLVLDTSYPSWSLYRVNCVPSDSCGEAMRDSWNINFNNGIIQFKKLFTLQNHSFIVISNFIIFPQISIFFHGDFISFKRNKSSDLQTFIEKKKNEEKENNFLSG